MTVATNPAIHYPTGDGQPVAETFAHLYAILMTIEVLRLYLQGQQATVLGNQFLYYEQGDSNKRVAPDVFVIFNVEPGGRDNYKIWEESSIPSITFDVSTPLNTKMTSPSTKKEDDGPKKQLYAQIGIQKYWQFDPKGEWIKEQLRGYQLENGHYQPITNNISRVLQLRLEVDNSLSSSPTALIAFYRLDTEAKLLLPVELQAKARIAEQEALFSKQEVASAQQEALLSKQEAASAQQKVLISEQRATLAEQKSLELAAQLAAYQARFGFFDSSSG
jgi:Uma2 family endonuclease